MRHRRLILTGLATLLAALSVAATPALAVTTAERNCANRLAAKSQPNADSRANAFYGYDSWNYNAQLPWGINSAGTSLLTGQPSVTISWYYVPVWYSNSQARIREQYTATCYYSADQDGYIAGWRWLAQYTY